MRTTILPRRPSTLIQGSRTSLTSGGTQAIGFGLVPPLWTEKETNMRQVIKALPILLASAACISRSDVQAQPVRPAPTAEDIAARLRTRGVTGEALQML